MPTSARPLTTTALVAALLGLAMPFAGVAVAPAYAADEPTCTPQTLAMQARQAQAVFAGEVTDTRATRLPDGQRGVEISHDVTVAEVYKAARVSVSAQVQVLSTRNVRGACDLGRLEEGGEVVFFVRADPEADDVEPLVFVATGDSGTTPADADVLASLEEILPNPVPPIPRQPMEAEFEALPVDRPVPLTRAVAPGAALVVLGLLGLVVVGRWSRRS